MKKNQRYIWLRVLILLLVILLTLVLVINREKVRNLGMYGYPGIFLVSLLANATIIIPIPGILFTTAMGAVFNPIWVALIAGLGSAIGELTGYLAGLGEQVIVEKRGWYARVTTWMKKYGNLTIFVLALIPNPLFDLAGMAAGALKMPVWRFLLWCSIGKILKMIIFAYSGSRIISLIS